MLATVAVGGVVDVGLSAFFSATSSFVLAAVLWGTFFTFRCAIFILRFGFNLFINSSSRCFIYFLSRGFIYFLCYLLRSFLNSFLLSSFILTAGTVSTAGSGKFRYLQADLRDIAALAKVSASSTAASTSSGVTSSEI